MTKIKPALVEGLPLLQSRVENLEDLHHGDSALEQQVQSLANELASIQTSINALSSGGNDNSALELQVQSLANELASIQTSINALSSGGNDNSALELEQRILVLENEHDNSHSIQNNIDAIQNDIDTLFSRFFCVHAFAYCSDNIPEIHDKSSVFFNTDNATYSVFQNDTWSSPADAEGKSFLAVDDFKIFFVQNGTVAYRLPPSPALIFATLNKALFCSCNNSIFPI